MATMSSSPVPILLPGDEVPHSHLPNPSGSKAITLGPGLRHIPPSTILACTAGALQTDARKHAAWLEGSPGGRYVASSGDLVIGTVHHSSTDFYHVALSAHTTLAVLPQLAFENATRKTRPILANGALVYAQVSAASRFMDTELACVSATSGKAEGMGLLKGGMVFDVSLGFARRLMMGKSGRVVVLDKMAEKVGFEVAVGRNGRVWVKAKDVKTTLAVRRVLVEVDEMGHGVEEQKELVRKALKGL